MSIGSAFLYTCMTKEPYIHYQTQNTRVQDLSETRSYTRATTVEHARARRAALANTPNDREPRRDARPRTRPALQAPIAASMSSCGEEGAVWPDTKAHT